MRIRVIDLESTGDAPPEHAVCEIGWCDVVATEIQENFLEGKKGWSGWKVAQPDAQLINPGRAMPAETSAIHHLIDSDVAHAPSWEKFAPGVLQPVGSPMIDAFAAHSIKFERRFIPDELTGGKPWICTYKCALRLWPDAPLHSNQGLRYHRNPVGLVRALSMPAHRAGPDAYVTAHHLRDLLNLAPIEDLIKWSGQPALQKTCHLGRNTRGMKWTDVDHGFLDWCMRQDWLGEDEMFTVQHEIKRRKALTTNQPESATAK